MSDKPIHVQVAEALGWTTKFMGSTWWGFPGPGLYAGEIAVPRYDTDWSATGPLIEKYNVNLEAETGGWSAYNYPEGESIVTTDPEETPLLAVCSLILALHKDGKL